MAPNPDLPSRRPSLLFPSNTSFISPLHDCLSSQSSPPPYITTVQTIAFSINGLTSVALIFTSIKTMLFGFIFSQTNFNHFLSLLLDIFWWLEGRVWRRWWECDGNIRRRKGLWRGCDDDDTCGINDGDGRWRQRWGRGRWCRGKRKDMSNTIWEKRDGALISARK